MPLGNPIDAWLQMAQQKNANQRNMVSDIGSLGQGVGDAFGSIGQIIGEQKKKQLIDQIVQAMKVQGAPQQGPQMPPMQGPQMPGQAPPPPPSGMGGPPQDNSALLKSLLMKADPQGTMGAMEGQLFPTPQAPMTPLQQSEVAKNNAMTTRLGQPPQPKPTNPLDDEVKRRRAEVLAAILKKMGQPPAPKPINPVAAAALDVNVQKANNASQFRWPWQKAPLIKNPLKSGATTQIPAEAQGLTDEELMAIASQDDSSQ